MQRTPVSESIAAASVGFDHPHVRPVTGRTQLAPEVTGRHAGSEGSARRVRCAAVMVTPPEAKHALHPHERGPVRMRRAQSIARAGVSAGARR